MALLGFSRRSMVLWGVFLVILGICVLFSNYGVMSFPFNLSRDWPVILIAWGLLKIFDAFTYKPKGWLSFFNAHSCADESKEDKLKEVIEALEKGQITPEEAKREIRGD